jgi:hypothetical protein
VLAEAANVSIAVAARFVAALEEEGYLDTRHADLRVRSPLEFLQIWTARVGETVDEESVAQFSRGPLDSTEFRALMAVTADAGHTMQGLFGAAEALGLGRVGGASRYLYLESFEQRALDNLGVVIGGAPGPSHNLIGALPAFPRSTFGGSVVRGGQRVTDVIQTWLDACHHRVRGEELAGLIWRKALEPSLADL